MERITDTRTDYTVVKQLGAYDQCASRGCPVTSVRWRVILGHWVVQVYTCQRHLAWACELDLLTQDTGTAMGWTHGYPVGAGDSPGYRQLRETKVTPCIAAIRAVNYRREVMVSATYPQRGTVIVDGTEVEVPVYSAGSGISPDASSGEQLA